MNNNEFLQKAKDCKSVNELIELAKANSIELSVDNATELLNTLSTRGLSEEELGNIAGGINFNFGGKESTDDPKDFTILRVRNRDTSPTY